MGLSSELTPADIAAVTGNNSNGMFGDGSWWIIILFLFIFAGWNSGGGYGTGNAGAAQNYVLASDFATLQRQLSDGFNTQERRTDAIINGISSLGYTEAEKFGAVNLNMSQGFANAELARSNGNTALMQEINGLGRQLSDCCCQNRYDALQNSYAVQTAVKDGFCQTNYNMGTNTRDVIDNQNANARAILDALAKQEVARKDEKIAEQNQQIFNLQLAASQANQNNYLINQLKPCPVPAYLTCNPNGAINYSINTNGGCNCC